MTPLAVRVLSSPIHSTRYFWLLGNKNGGGVGTTDIYCFKKNYKKRKNNTIVIKGLKFEKLSP